MCFPSPIWVQSLVFIHKRPKNLHIWLCCYPWIHGFHGMILHFRSYLSHLLIDFASIWVILKSTVRPPWCRTGKNPKSLNAEGSGSDQKPRPKSPRASSDRNKPTHATTAAAGALFIVDAPFCMNTSYDRENNENTNN